MSRTRAIRPLPPLTAAVALAFLGPALATCSSEGVDDPGSADGSGGDSTGDGSSGDGDSSDIPPPAPPQCDIDDECVAAASTCCECPTFAVPEGSDGDEACQPVDCEFEIECPKVMPVCTDRQCQLICEPIIATQQCAAGFASDDFGCLVDRCFDDEPDPNLTCTQDADCIRVEADCCGCARGGTDTAVAVARVDAFRQWLDCGPDPACPGEENPLCEEPLIERCIAQRCTLISAIEEDGGGRVEPIFCGAPPEYGECPDGLVCLLNAIDADEANRIGVGTCGAALQ